VGRVAAVAVFVATLLLSWAPSADASTATSPTLPNVILGDSQTYYAAKDNPTVQPWVSSVVGTAPGCGLLKDSLCGPPPGMRFQWNKAVALVALSIGGAPTTVVAQLGTDDALTHTPTYINTYERPAIAAFVKLFPASTQIYWVNVPYPPAEIGDKSVDAVNKQIALYAAKHANIFHVIDLHDAFEPNPAAYTGPDGLHYNAAGQALYANLVATTIGAK
jgi:hypothetical protein